MTSACSPTLALHRQGPAERWLEALPLGNGRLGAMLWGDPRAVRFSLNESTLWSGGPQTDVPHRTGRREAGAALARSRTLFENGDVPAAQREIERLGASWSQAYLPVGDLFVRLEGLPGTDMPAERILDLEHAEHRVQAESGEHLSFVSRADEVLVHFAPCPDGAVPSLEFSSPLVEERRDAHKGGLTVLLRAPSDIPAGQFRREKEIAWESTGASRAAVVVRWQAQHGRLLLVCAVVTTWQGLGQAPDRDVQEVLDEASAQAETALARGAEELRRRHRAAPLPGAGEVALTLSGSPEAELLATSFAYGRHLLASASRPGLPPANLQGLWNTRLEAPWSSNFTVNINLEMNHWAAGVAQVPDATAALEQYVAMLRTAGQETARRLYGADGWTVHHNSDPWGYTDPVRGEPSWSTWPMGGLWLERELDSLASFSGRDAAEIARDRFPALREAVAFALCLLHDSADGHLATFPSTSPENLWLTEKGTPVSLSEGTGMDRWLLHETAQHLLEAAALLGQEQDPVVQRARSALALVPGPRIGADERVLEWHRDGLVEAEPHHRHVSHLGFLYPGNDPVDPRLEQAVTRSLEARGDEATGWSLVWKACLWARLHRGDRVQALLELYLRPAETADGERSGLYPNLFSAHPPFQIDGNLGIVAALAECLLQSHRGEIELLPALPPMMADGSMRGLIARPGVAVDMAWSDGALTSLQLHATGPGALGTHRVRCGNRVVSVRLTGMEPVELNAAALRSARKSETSGF
ncbi:glycosyl hydrolase family 95 catalytic domain-containing protein [uncultured Brachybacterium sp.]|uniref:glycosyl hydrolase family 95 catalytic domain-containing protein n=1 Tax=uncultured Brachybacterium sp. TaxID=189680 RepID=UPI00261B1B89|nr:glycoside hydrolase N-terminal domain-containing protein [uncultured Brachybacterium sp.]